jgi:hypothetical protein
MATISDQRNDKPVPLLLTGNRQRFEKRRDEDKKKRTCSKKRVSDIALTGNISKIFCQLTPGWLRVVVRMAFWFQYRHQVIIFIPPVSGHFLKNPIIIGVRTI